MKTNISDQILWLEKTKSNIPVDLLPVTPNTNSVETDARETYNAPIMANRTNPETPQINKSNPFFPASSSSKVNGNSNISKAFQISPFADQFPRRTSGNLLSLNSPLSKFLTNPYSYNILLYTNRNF